MTKFAANNNKLAFTKFFPFFTIEYLHFYINFEIVKLFNTSSYRQIFKQKTLNFVVNIQIT